MDISMILPRVLIVSRRTVRKKKFVDFVGEYHLDLIVRYGAVPVIIPRVSGVHMLLESFEPIHGVLLCEGEDIDHPSLYDAELTGISPEELEEIRKLHASDTAIDREKDSIELRLAKLCLKRNIPYLGICRGYHHQSVKRLAQRFVPMAFAPDGLVEGFYDPDAYNPKEGKFIMGLQFHPERMRHPSSDNFDYPGCSSAYQEFVKAVIAHEKKLNCSAHVPKAPKLNHELIAGSEFLEANTALSLQQENRLKQMGATVRNSSMYLERLMKNEERERVARIIMEKMSIEQLSDLLSLYQMMGRKCSEELEKKLQDLMKEEN
ncbi:hypothetical protein ACB092_08G153300 [Castanea dentata]